MFFFHDHTPPCLESESDAWNTFNPPGFSIAVQHIGFVQTWDPQPNGKFRGEQRSVQDCVPLTDILRSAGVGPRIDLMSVDVEHQEKYRGGPLWMGWDSGEILVDVGNMNGEMVVI